jgi:hypothetical protein
MRINPDAIEARRTGDQDIAMLAAEVRRLRRLVEVEQDDAILTDAERSAIVWCVAMAETTATDCDEELEALRGLLERERTRGSDGCEWGT